MRPGESEQGSLIHKFPRRDENGQRDLSGPNDALPPGRTYEDAWEAFAAAKGLADIPRTLLVSQPAARLVGGDGCHTFSGGGEQDSFPGKAELDRAGSWHKWKPGGKWLGHTAPLLGGGPVFVHPTVRHVCISARWMARADTSSHGCN